MAKKIKLGDFNRLRIVKKVDFGLYLDGGDEGEILLPSRYVPENVGIGDELDVFLYLDQEERLFSPRSSPKRRAPLISSPASPEKEARTLSPPCTPLCRIYR